MAEATPINVLNVPFEDIFGVWDDLTKKNTDVRAMRALALWDRFYLLAVLLNRKDMLHSWLYERCREVEASPDGYLDLWARAHYKSTTITFAGAIQEVLRNPDITIGIFSHTSSIAKAFLKQIKQELEKNERLKALFPDILWQNPQTEAPGWSVDSGLIVRRAANPKEATIEAHGLVDGMPTGRHYQLMIYDDVVVPASVSTPEQVEKTTEAWALSDNLGSEHPRKWMVGTRYSFADTYDTIMKRGAAIPRIYPATDDGTFTGKPVLLTQAELDRKIREQGDYVASCQLMQNPIAGAQRMFDPTDLVYYEIRPATLNVYICCDPARSKKKGSDNTAYAVVGIDYAFNKYLLDGFNHKMDLSERWVNLAGLVKKWQRQPGVQKVKVGYEAFAAQADLDYMHEKMREERFHFTIEELMWPREGEGSKVDRVQRLGPDMKEHKIFLPYATNEKQLTKNQQKMVASGQDYRVARPIRRAGDDQRVYDLSEQFVQQVTYFPFSALKDLIDGFSRIYDMEPSAPTSNEQRYYEPSFT